MSNAIAIPELPVSMFMVISCAAPRILNVPCSFRDNIGFRYQLPLDPVRDEGGLGILRGFKHIRVHPPVPLAAAALTARHIRHDLAGNFAGSRVKSVGTALQFERAVNGVSGSVRVHSILVFGTFRQAAVLADAMVSGDLQAYNRMHPRLFLRPNLMARLMLLMDGRPLIREGAIGALSAAPSVFRKLLAVHVGA